jgi:hypothetical protein
MTDLLVLDSNIVQTEDVGGSNPLCSTRKSANGFRGDTSKRTSWLVLIVRPLQRARHWRPS